MTVTEFRTFSPLHLSQLGFHVSKTSAWQEMYCYTCFTRNCAIFIQHTSSSVIIVFTNKIMNVTYPVTLIRLHSHKSNYLLWTFHHVYYVGDFKLVLGKRDSLVKNRPNLAWICSHSWGEYLPTAMMTMTKRRWYRGKSVWYRPTYSSFMMLFNR